MCLQPQAKKSFQISGLESGADTNFDIIGFVYDNPMQRFIICSDATLTDKATAIATIFKTQPSQAREQQMVVQQLVFLLHS